MADQNTPRAFSGIDRLYGNGAYAKLQNASVTIVGIGGVGSWAAEAISRHGILNINIIDLDNVAAVRRTWVPLAGTALSDPELGRSDCQARGSGRRLLCYPRKLSAIAEPLKITPNFSLRFKDIR
jgi:hypothetical protein